MPRLIDADALAETLEALSERTPSQRDTLRIIASGLRSDELFAPTIDPESLRPHGRWVNVRMLVGGFAEQWGADCPNCGKTSKEPLGNYCYNCGWRLDLEE